MTKRLWDYFDGEPFLTNPHLAVLTNPRSRLKSKTKGKKVMATKKRRTIRRRTTRVRARRRTTTRRSSHKGLQVRIVNPRKRRNPYPIAGAVINPRRRRSHRSYRRNPAFMGISLPPMQSVLFAGVGLIAPPMLEGFITQFIPASITSSTFGKYGVRIAAVLGLSMLTKKVIGQSEGNMVAIGGGAYILTTAIKEFMPNLIPGMSGYTISNGGLGAYVPSSQNTFSSLGLPSASFPGSQTRNDVPTRFNRF